MFTIRKLLQPDTIKEAYQLLQTEAGARIIAGGLFLRLSERLTIDNAIDISGLGLDRIEEKEDHFRIGAMVTLRDLETDKALNGYFNGMIGKSVSGILGVQFRNLASAGGTVAGRYGFSDLITALLALDVTLEFEGHGVVDLDRYLADRSIKKDLLKYILIKKNDSKCACQLLRNSETDFAILNVAVSKLGKEAAISVGARPKCAEWAYRAMDALADSDWSDDALAKVADMAAEELSFGNNRLASAEYRKDMCRVLVLRALKEVRDAD
jgi:CO/xanthine dehydrogenase FAD-binding subunit